MSATRYQGKAAGHWGHVVGDRLSGVVDRLTQQWLVPFDGLRQGGREMTAHYLKSVILTGKSRHRESAGVHVARLAILFTIICSVATVVMLLS